MLPATNMIPDDDFADFDESTLYEGKLKDAMLGLTPNLKLVTEKELIAQVDPTPTLWEMRRKFGKAFEEAKAGARKRIDPIDIYGGVTTRGYFFNDVVVNPLKVAFVTRPIVDFGKLCEEIMRLEIENIKEFLCTTKLTEKNAGIRLKQLQFLADRALGSTVQKMQIQSKNLNVEVDAKQLPDSQDSLNLREQLEEAKKKLLTAPRDVSETSNES